MKLKNIYFFILILVFTGFSEPKTKTIFNKFSKCPNTTKRISFQIESDEFKGSGYYYHNILGEESFMPNESWQQLYRGEMKGFTLNTINKKNQQISYTIDQEGRKFKMIMNLDSLNSNVNEALFSAKFNKNFKKSGNKKKFLNTNEYQYEYVGKDDEGKKMIFWLAPAGNVCYSNINSITAGIFNLGYILIDGITYVISEISGNNFNIKVTDIKDGNYSFDTKGYVEMPKY